MKKSESGQFKQWLKKPRDETGGARIVSRINRLMEGLPGDLASVGNGVRELRIHYGPGYRVYFHQQGDMIIVLLCRGDKGTQRRDLDTAHRILSEWRKQRG